ncbi:MBL fold metallo-hydrolase [Lacimicrobium sp. SS2-24]|uniref:MBL fold metallo-hydrolase n=1 Tax=Lacimicrobium sp. SS2-24 TaxID=2005569 RepID=UPI000B4B103E|nr:MBL fold metallo-hydrolase [Lacimicrobium sp. SS2-24]
MMKRYLLLSVLLCVSYYSSAMHIKQIDDGVWVAIQPEQERFDDSNSLIVRGEQGVMIVDSQQSRDDVETLIHFVRQQIGQPITLLINTHWHGDHTQGNALYKQVYGDALTILGHTSHEEDVPGRAAKALQERISGLQEQLILARSQLEKGQKLDGSVLSAAEATAQAQRIEQAQAWVDANQHAKFVAADKFIDAPFDLSEYGFAARVLPLSGHTRADLAVYLPEQKLLACGDLVDTVPYVGHGDPRQWLSSLETIGQLPVAYWLPGHGELLRNNTLLDDINHYLHALLQQVSQHAHLGEQALSQHVDLTDSRTRLTGDDPLKQRFFDAIAEEAILQTYQTEHAAAKK